ncbi:MAG: right-handed parallel beta-helix repeat-containing protein [Synergistaceae bacterium]|nr:right-handed parallel beta-helix repeat-containing protein [Synergistaceae bacterium]
MVKIFFVLFFAVMRSLFVARQACAKEIRVKNAEEFIAAIDSDTTIVMEGNVAGPWYNIAAASVTCAKPGPGARWINVTEGIELDIKGVNDLTIRGADATLISGSRYAAVIAFDGCVNIRLEGLMLRHAQGRDKRDGAVLAFANCSGITIEKCDLAGGSAGVVFRNVKNAVFAHSLISDCALACAAIYNSGNIAFGDVMFTNINWNYEEDEGGPDCFTIRGSEDVTFDRCTFYEQTGIGFNVEDSRGVVVNDATFRYCRYSNVSAPNGAVELVHPYWIEEKGA